MNRAPQILRLSPQAAGSLRQQCTKTTTELPELTCFRKEFDRQLVALIGNQHLAQTKQRHPKRLGYGGRGQRGSMRQISYHHRKTAHASPAPHGPTRYRTPEESGMKMDQHTTQTSTASLCKAIGVDIQETNSLCCAAAGIIAAFSAAAEVLIPHQKLREAATVDATLIAQSCPPAQLAQGSKCLWLEAV